MRYARFQLPAAAALLLIAAVPALGGAVAPGSGQEAGPSARAAKPSNPCLDPMRRARLYCPDLLMKRPFGLELDRKTVRGRTVLRAGNSIDNVGLGPAELHGTRLGPRFMKGRQRIYKRSGGRLGIDTGARLFFKFVPGQLRYWKFYRAASFTLWRVDACGGAHRPGPPRPEGELLPARPLHTRPRRRRSPRRFVYPACSTDPGKRRVTIGTSVGWSDVYPPGYPEQWIDVTGLRGCFDYQHTADPTNALYESNERNNSAAVRVRLPFRPGRQRCPGAGTPPPDRDVSDPYGY